MERTTQMARQGLIFSGRVPLTVTVLDGPMSDEALLRQDARNYSLLKTFALEDHSARDVDPELEGVMAEVQRLDQKLNLIQELLTQLLMVHEAIPDRRPIALGLSTLTLTVEQDLGVKPGDLVLSALYLLDDVPRALELTGTVVSVVTEGEAEFRIDLSLPELSDGVDSLLGRFIFRQHRREIALKRGQTASQVVSE